MSRSAWSASRSGVASRLTQPLGALGEAREADRGAPGPSAPAPGAGPARGRACRSAAASKRERSSGTSARAVASPPLASRQRDEGRRGRWRGRSRPPAPRPSATRAASSSRRASPPRWAAWRRSAASRAAREPCLERLGLGAGERRPRGAGRPRGVEGRGDGLALGLLHRLALLLARGQGSRPGRGFSLVRRPGRLVGVPLRLVLLARRRHRGRRRCLGTGRPRSSPARGGRPRSTGPSRPRSSGPRGRRSGRRRPPPPPSARA